MIQLPPLEQVAFQGGLTPSGRNAWGPCPVCGAQKRGQGERRGPLAFYLGKQQETWKCWAGSCTAKGDALGLLAALHYQEIPPKGDARWPLLLSLLERQQLQRRPQQPAVAPPLPAFPPHTAIKQFWGQCIELNTPEAAPSVAFSWLTHRRNLDPSAIAALQLARILPRTLLDRPSWLPTLGIPLKTWLALYRLAVPLYDETGLLRSLRFRLVDRWRRSEQWVLPDGCQVDAQERLFYGTKRLPKALSARGSAQGLVMADPMAQSLLAGTTQDRSGVGWDGWVLITEGEPDWWAVCTQKKRFSAVESNKQTFAAFSVEAGSWTAALASRIPAGAHVRIWTDHDTAGETYATRIYSTLKTHCDVQRVNRPSTWGSL